MSNFVEARQNILDEMTKELIGPGSDIYPGSPDEEIIADNPVKRYTVGMLFPQLGSHNEESDAEDEEEGAKGGDGESGSEPDPELSINLSNQMYPSCLGMTFLVARQASLDIKVSYGKYRKLSKEECFGVDEGLPEEVVTSKGFQDAFKNVDGNWVTNLDLTAKEEFDPLLELSSESGFRRFLYGYRNMQTNGWMRHPFIQTFHISALKDNPEKRNVNEDATLEVRYAEIPSDPANYAVTVSLYNIHEAEQKDNKFIPSRTENAQMTLFQVSMTIESRQFDSLPDNVAHTESEEKLLSLLYRNKRKFAVGHGCATQWDPEEKHPRVLRSSFLPTCEVPRMDFDISELRGTAAESVLYMYNLSTLSGIPDREILNGISDFISSYSTWLDSQEKEIDTEVPANLRETARNNIKGCRKARDRMFEGHRILSSDANAMKAFRLSNKAMLMQRNQSEYCLKEVRYPEDPGFTMPALPGSAERMAKWRPFQLAFQLLNISGLVDNQADDRSLVDLIWFPTGGGKTEAYLGMTAFMIFYRRMRYGKQGCGTSVLMRYTLRLLTAQQFQRAATLICACELIRKEQPALGTEQIDIGLWVGGDSTPNKLKEAEESLDLLQKFQWGAKNPSPILSCPWCGTSLEKKKVPQTSPPQYKGKWGYQVQAGRNKGFRIFCVENTCPFKASLPIYVVDEDIYRHPPTLLFGTVDKFAMLSWNEGSSALFSLDPGNSQRSPELIIQDELHLISGPLGSLTGIFETAIDALCSHKGVKPKIVASTATIRRAGEQCRNLYNRRVEQFPPPVLASEDSFFTREVPISQSRGRLYVGLMSSGTTQTTAEIRLLSILTYAAQSCSTLDEVKDKFWTLVVYFNSLRELGKCSTLINDDVKDHLIRLRNRKYEDVRLHLQANELNSRTPPEDIPKILEQLKIGYPQKGVLSNLLASNMISVGIDVERLSLMVVAGQPKTTSEYIQATSRIGRKFPGIVTVLYDGVRPRDRSHFEDFLNYHQAFYSHVEPTSVTPFSGRSRERALTSVYLVLLRHLFGFQTNDSIQRYPSMAPDAKQSLFSLILSRVRDIEEEEMEDTKGELEEIDRQIQQIIDLKPDRIFVGHKMNDVGLLWPFGMPKPWTVPALQSLRNVDPESTIRVRR